MENFQKVLVKAPGWSVHHQKPTRKFSTEIGLVNPVFYRKLGIAQTMQIDFNELVRTAALASPTYHRFRISFQAFAVPEKFLQPYFDGTKFYNLNTPDTQKSVMPYFGVLDYCLLCADLLRAGYKLSGSLLDFLGYPTFDDVYYSIKEKDQSLYMGDGVQSEDIYYNIVGLGEQTVNIMEFQERAELLDFIRFGNVQVQDFTFFSFLDAFLGYGSTSPSSSSFADVSKWLNDNGYNIVDLSDRYWSWLFACVIGYVALSSSTTLSPKPFSAVPFLVYWKIIADWYLNSNVIDPDIFWSHVGTKNADGSFTPGRAASEYLTKVESLLPFHRFWQSDYFTSATPTPQSGEAVPLPSGDSSNVPALWVAEALQKLAIKQEISGPRYQDWAQAIYGHRPSDDVLERATCLGSYDFPINISEVTQTNAADFDVQLDSPIGTQYGQGISYDGGHMFKYTADEDSYVMVMCSIVPDADYTQGVDALLRKTEPSEFLIPDFEPLGPQAVMKSEVQFSLGELSDASINDAVLAWQPRRFAEFIYMRNSVHGDFKTSLDYWQDARQLQETVVFDRSFLQIDAEKDNLNRIFAVPEGVDHWYVYLAFDVHFSLPINRYIQIGL